LLRFAAGALFRAADLRCSCLPPACCCYASIILAMTRLRRCRHCGVPRLALYSFVGCLRRWRCLQFSFLLLSQRRAMEHCHSSSHSTNLISIDTTERFRACGTVRGRRCVVPAHSRGVCSSAPLLRWALWRALRIIATRAVGSLLAERFLSLGDDSAMSFHWRIASLSSIRCCRL